MSAITLHLGRRFESGELHLHLPAAPNKIEEQLTMLDDYAEDLSKPVELRDVDCEITGIRQYLRLADLSREDEIDRLNTLAEKITGMDWLQRDLLRGALDSESISSLNEVIHIADNLDQYELLVDVRNDRDLGVHLAETGWKDFPEHVRPYLDYAAIGIEYYAEHTGAFTGSGYVRKKGQNQQMETAQKPPVLTVQLYAPGKGIACSLDLPASDGLLEQAMRTLGVTDLAEADIHGIEDLSGYMDNCVDMGCPSVETINELARFVSGHFTSDEEWTKFVAVCEAAHASTWQEMLDTATDLDNYQLYRAFDPEEFGELRAAELMESGKDIMVEMEGFINYDYRGFGEVEMDDLGVRETEHGYVRRLSGPFPNLGFEQSMGQL